MMQLFNLKLVATFLCFVLGALASWGLLTLELSGDRENLLIFLSLGCLPLGIVMVFDTLITRPEV
tara:strand:+ start:772 stop:966 length:195 start_codon:yes stop_codon:yes gene_type:complete